MYFANKKNTTNGFQLLEAVLAVATFSLILTALVGVYLYGEESTRVSIQESKALYLAHEGLEAVQNIRDDDFSLLTPGTYGLALVGNVWTLQSGADITSGITRQIAITSIDANTRRVDSQVTWNKNSGRSGTIILTAQLANWQAATSGYWTNILEESFEDLPGSQNALKVVAQGNYAYIVTSENNSEFQVLDISQPANPNMVAFLNLGGSGPMNMSVLGSYVYLATRNNSKELQTISVSAPTHPSVSGTYNASGTIDGQGVFVASSNAYLIRKMSSDPEFFILDVSNPETPALLGSLNIGSDLLDIFVSGNYAYIATTSDTSELVVINVSNPESPNIVATVDISGNTDALSIYGLSTTLFVGTSSDNLVVYDISNEQSPTLLSSLSLGGDVVDVTAHAHPTNGRNYAFVVVDNSNAEVRVIDTTTPSQPTIDGTFNASYEVSGVAYDSVHDKVIIVGDANNKEFVVLSP